MVNGAKSWLIPSRLASAPDVPTRVKLMHQSIAGKERAILDYHLPAPTAPLAMMMWSPSRELCPIWQRAIRKIVRANHGLPVGFGSSDGW